MRKLSGFTLVELSVVLAIVALIASMVCAYNNYMSHIFVSIEINKLALSCRYLQNVALMTGQEQVLIFDPAHKQYVYNGTVERLSRSVEFGAIHGAKGPPYDPVQTITKPITFKDNKIKFYPNGIIQPGAVYLINNDKQIMYALSSSVCQISNIRVYKYDNGWQHVTSQ